MEHFYQSIDGFMNHRNTVMLDHVIRGFPQDGTWVELGSWTGRSTAYCVVELINRGWQGRFMCVDSWHGGEELAHNANLATVRNIFFKNSQPIQDRIEIFEGMSWDAAAEFSDDSVDFCYVDAGHDYDSVSRDLKAWWPRIRSGSWFAGDDYTKGYPELQQAVWDFFGLLEIKVSRMGRCWIVKKP
jgi:predicted O-methyltransferase YrrM